MKSYSHAAQKAGKSQPTTTGGPTHRIYQRKSWEKHSAVAARRQALAATQRVADQKGRLQQLLQNRQHNMYHRHYSQTTHGSQSNGQNKTYSNVMSNNGRRRVPLRMVWLQQKVQQPPKALGLRTRFIDAGLQVQVCALNLEDDTPLEGELILLECFSMFEQEMMKALVRIRLFTQAPLIVLTDNHTLEWSIRALHNGADAIFTVNMPDDVIVARSNALLRRWVSM
jgi:hypothetical protein